MRWSEPQTLEEREAELRARCEADPEDYESQALLLHLLFEKVDVDHLNPHDEHGEHHDG